MTRSQSPPRRRRLPAAGLLVVVGALGLVLAPAAARAAPEGRAELRLGLLRFAYAEHDGSGPTLDREAGWVPAASGELELRGARLFGRAAARLGQGNVSYLGHTQSVTDPNLDGLPLRSRTDVSFVSGELAAGVHLETARRLALFGAVGARRWTRDIRDAAVFGRDGTPATVGGLSEIYSWYELQAGARWSFLARPRTTWDAEVRVVRTAGAEISVDLGKAFGIDQTARMALGDRTGWRLGTTLRQDLEPAVFLVVSLFVEGYAFGGSRPFVFVDAAGATRGLVEPRSDTVSGGLELGVGGRY